MSEFLFELYSEEIPSNLQIAARKEIKEKLEISLKEFGVEIKKINAYSTPTRLTIHIENLPLKIVIPSKEIRGPKVGVIEDILNNFLRANKSNKKNRLEKDTDKGKFFFLKTI